MKVTHFSALSVSKLLEIATNFVIIVCPQASFMAAQSDESGKPTITKKRNIHQMSIL